MFKGPGWRFWVLTVTVVAVQVIFSFPRTSADQVRSPERLPGVKCSVLAADPSFIDEMLLSVDERNITHLSRRIALVVGNSAYNEMEPLKNPANDAKAMAEQFQLLGFEVHIGIDLDDLSLGHCIAQFAAALAEAPTALSLFFYAGHGVQLASRNDLVARNYMLSVDAGIQPDGTGIGFTQIDPVLDRMRARSDRTIFLYDACRNDPLNGDRPETVAGQVVRQVPLPAGAAEISESKTSSQAGMYIAFAAASGRTADDEFERHADHSPFTRGLMNHISTPGFSIEQVLSRVSNDVERYTGGRQTPWTSSSIASSKSADGILLNGQHRFEDLEEHLHSMKGNILNRVLAEIADGSSLEASLARRHNLRRFDEAFGVELDEVMVTLRRARIAIDRDVKFPLFGPRDGYAPSGNSALAEDSSGRMRLWNLKDGGSSIAMPSECASDAEIPVFWSKHSDRFVLECGIRLTQSGAAQGELWNIEFRAFDPVGNEISRVTISTNDPMFVKNRSAFSLDGSKFVLVNGRYSPEGWGLSRGEVLGGSRAVVGSVSIWDIPTGSLERRPVFDFMPEDEDREVILNIPLSPAGFAGNGDLFIATGNRDRLQLRRYIGRDLSSPGNLIAEFDLPYDQRSPYIYNERNGFLLGNKSIMTIDTGAFSSTGIDLEIADLYTDMYVILGLDAGWGILGQKILSDRDVSFRMAMLTPPHPEQYRQYNDNFQERIIDFPESEFLRSGASGDGRAIFFVAPDEGDTRYFSGETGDEVFPGPQEFFFSNDSLYLIGKEEWDKRSFLPILTIRTQEQIDSEWTDLLSSLSGAEQTQVLRDKFFYYGAPHDPACRQDCTEREKRKNDGLTAWSEGWMAEQNQAFSGARSAYERSCNLGLALSCESLGSLIYKTATDQIGRNEAREHWKTACELGDARGCASFGITMINENDLAFAGDEARQLLYRACDLGSTPGCTGFALMLYFGHAGFSEPALANKLFHKSCNDGQASACEAIKDLFPAE